MKRALEHVVACLPNIATNRHLFWIFDETEVTGEFGKNVKVFYPRVPSEGVSELLEET